MYEAAGAHPQNLLAAAATSLVSLSALSAQRVYRIGYLSLGAPPRGRVHDLDLKPLADLGWVEGKNITGEVRYAADGSDQLPQFAAQLVQLKVDIIATNGTDAALAARTRLRKWLLSILRLRGRSEYRFRMRCCCARISF